MQGSWLFPDGVDRERMLDMDRHIRPARRAAFGMVGLGLLACGPWVGWWTLAPLALAFVAFRLADARILRMAHPETGLFTAFVIAQVIIAGSIVLAGPAGISALCWLAIPLAPLAARFSERGIVVGAGVSVALTLAVGFGMDHRAVLDDPTLLISPLTLIVALTIFQTVLMRSDVDTRAQAVIDPLTGMLNRKALTVRAAELTQQSEVMPKPVGLIIGDLDRFKAVNDTLGHVTGDAVLKDVAYVIREELRAFDFAYRIGGEEFVVLVPGADVDQALLVAEQLRGAVEAAEVGGQSVTMSFGVSASPGDAPLEYELLFADADRALYEAKDAGRNCVRTSVAADALAAVA
jgi:diguanylate cyclase (GGDEF)-like protein